MKKIAVLGSTGSIGTQSLEVVRTHPDRFLVTALTCGKNIDLFREQLTEFRPEFAAVASEEDCIALSAEYPHIEFSFGINGITSCAVNSGADVVINSLLGMMGILPTYEAIMAGKDIAFANKETLVAGGSLIMDAVKKTGVNFLPVDSEHSAIFQSLQGNEGNRIEKILLTASGGPFRGYTRQQMLSVTKEQALNHPRWKMGAKITIDSATMMNKGLEVIEASWLFGVDPADIQVLVHPQSALHSAVEFEDGAIIGQLGCPDMKVPIAYALSWPERLNNVSRSLDLFELGSLTFEKPDLEAFTCLKLAYDAIAAGASYPIVLNAANEEAVAAFLADRISFGQIADVVDSALQRHKPVEITCVDDILEVERQTRNTIEIPR